MRSATDQLEARPIPGTTNACQPQFSPDGQWLAFEVDGKERKVRLDGSAPVTIADAGAANGADWTASDEIVIGSTRPPTDSRTSAPPAESRSRSPGRTPPTASATISGRSPCPTAGASSS